jgi:hypothetical protein
VVLWPFVVREDTSRAIAPNSGIQFYVSVLLILGEGAVSGRENIVTLVINNHFTEKLNSKRIIL